jgi:hypothetical protein
MTDEDDIAADDSTDLSQGVAHGQGMPTRSSMAMLNSPLRRPRPVEEDFCFDQAHVRTGR